MSDSGALVYVVEDDISAREGVAGLIRSTQRIGGLLPWRANEPISHRHK